MYSFSGILSFIDWDRESAIMLCDQLELAYGGAYSVILLDSFELVMQTNP